MAVIVEDGTIVENANSYVDVTFVDTYATAFGYDTWAGTTEEKEAAVLKSAIYVDSKNYVGGIVSGVQEMSWPRTGAIVNGFLIDTDIIPTKIKNAQAEAA